MSKKLISTLVCVCFLFVFCINGAFAENIDNNNKFKVVQNDEKICTVMGEYEGDTLYATLDKTTNQVTMQAVEKSKTKFLGVPIGEDKITNYEVKIDNADENNISATISDTETHKEFKIRKSNHDKVIAQAVVLVPVLEILGQALLEYLIAATAVLIIAGATYYVASTIAEELRKRSYDYYQAELRSGQVYIGPAVDYNYALAAVEIGGNIFSRTQTLAKNLATAAGSGYRGPEIHGTGSNYFWHYHPKYGMYAEYAHCFY